MDAISKGASRPGAQTEASPTGQPAIGAAGFNLDFATINEEEEFLLKTEAYADGEMSDDAYRGYRLTRGVYGQRIDGIFMLRIKAPGGMLTPAQARTVAEIIAASPSRAGHITTRENFQIHDMVPAEIADFKEKLNAAGLTQVDACGNTVRNVVQDPFAGLHPDEAFDPTPYLQGLVRFFLGNPRSQDMPRKFKIAFSGSTADRGYAAINDIGLIAVRSEDDKPAFKVLCGGGLASLPRSAITLHDAWPANDILTPVCAAIDLFQDHGNRRLRSKARIKHVLRTLGDEAFVALYRTYLERVQADPPTALGVEPRLHEASEGWRYIPPTDAEAQASGLTAWARTSVSETRLHGKVFVTIRLDDGGELTPESLGILADAAEGFGEGVMQLTHQQNIVLRAVNAEDIPALFDLLAASNLARPGPLSIADVTSCPGTDTCNLGITSSRQLARRLSVRLGTRDDTDLTMKISGCHNSCGQHHIGTIGLHGAVKRIGGRVAPHYQLLVGGHIGGGVATFGETIGFVPSGRVEAVVDRLLEHADREKADGETAGDFLRRVTPTSLVPVVADLLEIEAADSREEDFVDVGNDTAFVVLRRKGECAA